MSDRSRILTVGADPRILIVGADPQLLIDASRLLRQAGYQVLEATSGEQGLRMAAEHRPELLLVDMPLPDMDGIEVCQQLKAHPALAASLVVLHSATRTMIPPGRTAWLALSSAFCA